jgi:hypothetical protein
MESQGSGSGRMSGTFEELKSFREAFLGWVLQRSTNVLEPFKNFLSYPMLQNFTNVPIRFRTLLCFRT